MSVAPIRVLVIDDSAFSRRTITRMLERSPLVCVVGAARDGEEALRKTLELRPDLITLDLEMPRMDGFTFLRLVMSRCPTPVIVISGRKGEQDVFRALDFGAVDFIAKPSSRAGSELETIEQELLRKVHAIRQLRIEKVRARLEAAPPVRSAHGTPAARGPRVAVIGSSTGGPAALMQILGSFERAPAVAVVVCQHMPEGFTRGFAERIDRLTPFAAREAQDGDEPEPGSVLVAPGGVHLEFERRAARTVARLVAARPGDKYAPSVDRSFASAAKHWGSELLAVVLTGMGDDGAAGVLAVKQSGGQVVAESEQTAVVFGMPGQAIRTGAVDAVLPLPEIASVIELGCAAARRSGA
ncbi:MAG: chemotaxis response regulator protein-glutamate methylesterase [Proteobacteria bacterium]|nr:MAG: chemotaxis response regulator protein-glutamate methylesterase [Pseudomonadota bacterium]